MYCYALTNRVDENSPGWVLQPHRDDVYNWIAFLSGHLHDQSHAPKFNSKHSYCSLSRWQTRGNCHTPPTLAALLLGHSRCFADSALQMLLFCQSLIWPRVGILSTESGQNKAFLWESWQTIYTELLLSDDDLLICIRMVCASCCPFKITSHSSSTLSGQCGVLKMSPFVDRHHCRTWIWMIIY